MCEIKAVSGFTKPCKRKFVRPSVYLELLHFVKMLPYGKWGWAPYISSSTVIFTFTCLCVSNIICYCIGMHMSYTRSHHWCICIDKFFKQCTISSDAKPRRRHGAPYLTHTKTVFFLAKMYDSATNKKGLFYINRKICFSFHNSHCFLLIWFSLSGEFTLEAEWVFTIRTAWYFRFEKYRLL